MQSAIQWICVPYRHLLPLFAAFVCLASAALADPVTFVPPGEHLSIQLPANPERKDITSEGTKIHEWTATDNAFFYLVQHGVHPGAVFQPSQMQADLQDFISGTKSTMSAQQTSTVPGPDGPLPALRFSFTMPNGVLGKGVWVIMGDEAFGAFILDQSKSGRQQAMDAFITSLRITR